MANKVFGDLETFPSANTGLYGFGNIITNKNILIRGNGSASTTTTISSNQTTNKHLLLPFIASISDTIISSSSSDTITNKIITDTSNVVHCDAFKTSIGFVRISSATPTGAGQVLVTTGSDTAIWATPGSTTASDALPLAGGTMLGNINMDNYRIFNVPSVPASSDDAVNKTFVLGSIPFSDLALVISDTAQNTSDLALVISDVAGLIIPTYTNWTNWTPAMGSGLKSPFTINAAKYSRIGDIVNILVDVIVTKDLTSDTIVMSGLPVNIGTFGVGKKIANMVQVIDLSDDTFTPARFVLDQTSPASITVELADFQDSHGYLIQGQFIYSA